jgi:hypothetical protein
LLVLLLGTLAGYLRIHTYATGQDPRTFLMLAEGILTGRETVDSGFVVPGWPLVLAGVAKLFGPYAAFWTNVPLFVLLVCTLQRLAEELTGSFRRGVVVASGSALLLLGGAPVNPHFLLWVFRQTPMYLTAALAWLCLVRAVARQAEGRTGRALGWLAGTAVWLAAGELVRETGVLVVPAMGLYLLAVGLGWAGPAGMARQTARVRWFPFALCAGLGAAALGAGVWIVWRLRLPVLTGQGASLVGYLPYLLHRPLPEWPMVTMLAWIPKEFGWIGTVCLAIGIVEAFRRRERRDFLFVFLLPALAYLVFDGLIKFHLRFFLSTLFFLAPLAMSGALAAGEWIWRAAGRAMARAGRPREREERLRPAVWPSVWAALLVWGGVVLFSIHPWGPRVSRADVEHALDVLEPWIDPARPLLVDGRARYLTDVVEVFTDWELEKVQMDSLERFQGEPPWIFVSPRDRAAIYQWAGNQFSRAEEVLENNMEVDPVPGEDGFSLGNSTYQLMQVRPWDKRRVACRLPPVPEFDRETAQPAIPLRLLVPHGAADRAVRFSFRGHPLCETRLHPEYFFLAVPTALLADACGEAGRENLELVVESDSPLPEKYQPEWGEPEGPLDLFFGPGFRPFCDYCLSEEFWEFAWLKNPVKDFPPWPAPTWAREFAGDGEVRLPAGLEGGEEGTELIHVVRVGLNAVYGDDEAQLALTLSLPEFPEAEPQTVLRPHSAKPQTFRYVFADLPRAPSRLHLHAEHEVEFAPDAVDNPRHSNVQLGRVQVYTVRRRDALSLPVGAAGDEALLGYGFFSPENAKTSSHGRWTRDQCDFILPLRGGRDCRLALDYSEFRPADIPPAEPRLELNGHPLETVRTDTGLEARLPAEWMERINHLVMRTGTWCPHDHHGATDHRQLGVFLRDIRVEPL